MSNIGFLLSPSKGWLGGVNYYRNLFLAIDKVASANSRVYVFVPMTVEASLVDEICAGRSVVTVVRTKLLERRSLPWLIWRASKRLFSTDVWVGIYLWRYRLAVFSHSAVAGAPPLFRAINWIPDFQHLYLPEFFSAQELAERDQSFREIAEKSDAVILSSETAAEDFRRFSPSHAGKAKVLRFVAQVPDVYWGLCPEDEAGIRKKYGIEGGYFYLPNQFWKHKNHMVAFAALGELWRQGVKVTLVCSGALQDYRSDGYLSLIEQRLQELGICEGVKLLGIVPYADVYALMKFSVCVINPSRFEGWSSTVEECKSVGKRLVLSDIPVHREQTGDALFFQPDDVNGLVAALLQVLQEGRASDADPQELKAILEKKTDDFGRHYLDIVSASLAAR